ncbi:MAG: UDP-N-acetylmuramoyl-L-alanine--D-glutamate ligase [Candidatus Omnitrophica bacterium CG11_big_fil_rev_8_21_14_0_20_45_26]|uniref:UDP-N-acetylmuramoylalanine--D-glutamate ligase n=1 Tax=Candidatus Abzuiibacterium crystallinum TaxID=1974748 RepID=A0A2H0LPC9_9BACT|nr:MAG: UDP-N-acetylmuramoyl-L-alanine--D-glutamate ligase [Candidatus Omnitrophica bacterium CG11_big_fil_rev_8_21_14_0_20_45_26]PIW64307.1 MAG: UDP-N-acetylmuramoyl-L-alanine--D-glutamate ligase [Candidatus Omnitrophica bacterium CG12_big_fil_rev_8_21_14_0_65_45_16]
MDHRIYFGADWHEHVEVKVVWMDWQHKKVTVLGLGKSGFDCAFFLKEKGADVFVSELAQTESVLENKKKITAAGIACEVGHHSTNLILKSDIIIISPGISPQQPIFQQITAAQIPVWSEIELAYQGMPGRVVAVTGTNGKTTVSTLVSQLLSEAGYPVVLCGNIGNTFIGCLPQMKQDSIAVVEVSSFQLQQTFSFRPFVAVMLNLTDNHFDWHGNFEHYAAAKFRIFSQQTQSDFAVLNARDPEIKRRLSSVKSQKLFFNESGGGNPNEEVCFAIGKIFKIPMPKIQQTLSNFKGIPHRLELLNIKSDIQYINDSKSTTIASLKWALERMEKPVVLIVGGQFKGGSFESLKSLAASKVAHAVLIGEAAELIRNAWQDVVPMTVSGSFREAIQNAKQNAKKNQTVLLSPACASFDMFKNYIDRGNQFRQVVQEIEGVYTKTAR